LWLEKNKKGGLKLGFKGGDSKKLEWEKTPPPPNPDTRGRGVLNRKGKGEPWGGPEEEESPKQTKKKKLRGER